MVKHISKQQEWYFLKHISQIHLSMEKVFHKTVAKQKKVDYRDTPSDGIWEDITKLKLYNLRP